ncbi:dTDP-4-dehydrorhamnose reductase [Rhodobacteraceae bacterium R_SAG9]|nr:dTDP-4-dehydrorhamnose reductase [Rhodobacteraceae bacterium R_SAG9]
MSILVFGKTGQVASELQASEDVIALGRAECDFTDTKACVAAIARYSPSAVINAVAYTAVDKAEEEEERANLINGVTPGALAKACADMGIPILHISTDYVFDGSGTEAFAPNHSTAPLNAYGRSKLLGERAIQEAGGVHAILRTSWVISAHGTNFIKTMLRLGSTREQLTVVSDQVGGPTCAKDIAEACLSIVRQLQKDSTKSGIYHFSGFPDVSWAALAREIFVQSDVSCEVVDIPTTDYPTPAVRPLNSRIDNSTTNTVFGISRPDWRDGLKDILKDLGALKK